MGEYNAVSEQEVALIRRLAAKGMSANAIGRQLGRTGSCISKYAPECGERYRARPVFSVTIKQIPEVLHKALSDAARRRSMKLETIMLRLVGGTIMRGSIDKTLQKWNDYENERKLGTASAHSTAERKRASGDADMAPAKV
jgi:hypothetical protein